MDGRKYNLNKKWKNDKCRCECKKYIICEKDYIGNPPTYYCKNGKYLANIMDNSVIQQTKTVATNFNKIMQPAKQKSSIF